MGYLYNSLDYNVPYFAAHPPVYYSYPVPRTYGYSPFAYPPYVMTPEVVMEAQRRCEIINPYVPSSQAGAIARSSRTNRPQRESPAAAAGDHQSVRVRQRHDRSGRRIVDSAAKSIDGGAFERLYPRA